MVLNLPLLANFPQMAIGLTLEGMITLSGTFKACEACDQTRG